MARYCPNCSAQLKSQDQCWNCEAVFGHGSAWVPTDQPVGLFQQRERPVKAIAAEPTSAGSELGLVGKIFLYVFFLIMWLFGGVLTIAPGALMHGIEKSVGKFVLQGAFLFWATLPLTALVALVNPTKATGWALVGNFFLW